MRNAMLAQYAMSSCVCLSSSMMYVCPQLSMCPKVQKRLHA